MHTEHDLRQMGWPLPAACPWVDRCCPLPTAHLPFPCWLLYPTGVMLGQVLLLQAAQGSVVQGTHSCHKPRSPASSTRKNGASFRDGRPSPTAPREGQGDRAMCLVQGLGSSRLSLLLQGSQAGGGAGGRAAC